MEDNTFTTFGGVNLADGARYGGKIGRKRPAAISPTMSGAEALALAGIDWTVRQTQLSDLLDAPGAQDVFISQRSDNDGIVGVNGKKYNVIQNDVLAEIGDAIRKVRPDACYVGGGDLNNGKTTFLMMELEGGFDLGGGDEVRRNITLKKGHDGGAVTPLATEFRPFCTNQWTQLIRSAVSMASIPHTSTHEQRLRYAILTVQTAVQQHDEWDEALRRLLETPVRANDVFNTIVGKRPEKEGRALTEWEQRLDNLWKEYSQDFNANLVGTGAGVFMAAQGVDEHYGRGANKREQQQVGRLIRGAYPLAERALAVLS